MTPVEHDRGSSFKGLCLYLNHDKGNASTSNRVRWTHTQNLVCTDPDDVWFEMMVTWQDRDWLKEAAGIRKGPHDNTTPVYHLSLSWHPEQQPTDDEMRQAAIDALDILGLSEHQAYMVAHDDEDHPHVHIVANMIHPHSGRTANLGNNWYTLSRWAQKMEKRDGKIYCKERVVNNAARDAGQSAKHRSPSRWQWFQQVELARSLRNLDASLRYEESMQLAEQALAQSRAEHRQIWADFYRAQRDEAMCVGLVAPSAEKSEVIDPNALLAKLTDKNSTFTRVSLARALNVRCDSAASFAKAMAIVESHPDLVSLGKDANGQERLTTKEMLAIESRMMEHTDHLKGVHFAIPALTARRAIAGTILSDEQKNACVHVTAGHDIASVIGFAGTGKSTMLKYAREIWESQGYHVQGAAPTGIAASGLQGGSGINSRTLHSLKYAWEDGREKLGPKSVLVIDEAGMIGSRQMEDILGEVRKAGAKVVLVGDTEQLQSIGAGAAFRAIEERIGSAKITEVRRQHEAWQCAATIELATARTDKAITRYEDAGMVHAHNTSSEACDAVIAAWDQYRKDTPNKSQIIFAHRRHDPPKLNKLARELMRESGDLGPDHIIRADAGYLAIGLGERIRFTRNNRALGVMNGTLGTVTDICREGLTVRLDDERRTLAVDLSEYNYLDHGYAVTIHKAQGVTVDHAHMLATPGLDRHGAYVALSRHRDSVHMHWSKDDFRSRDNMVAKLSRENAKDTTLDYNVPQNPEGDDALITERDRAQYVFDNQERLAAGAEPLTDEQMLSFVKSPDTLADQVKEMHRHERQQLAQKLKEKAAELGKELLYQQPAKPSYIQDPCDPNEPKAPLAMETDMPKDEQGNWIPEPHKADGYTEKDKDAAQKIVQDFDKAADNRPPNRPGDQTPNAVVKPINKRIFVGLTPFGTMSSRNDLDSQKKIRAAQDNVEKHSGRSEKFVRMTWRQNEMKKEFQKSHDHGLGR